MKIIRPMIINNPALLSSNVAEADYAAYSAATTYTPGDRVIVVSPSPGYVVTMTIASPCVVSWTAHGLLDGTAVVFTTIGALPTGIVSGVAYYVLVLTVDTFMIAAVPNGAPISTSGFQGGAHTATASMHNIYESLQASNIGHTPRSSPTWWLDRGATNRWKMFDQSLTSYTSNPNSIVVNINALGRMNSVAMMNVSAASARFVMTDAVSGVVYDQTYSMVSNSGITDWYAYFFESITRLTDIIVLDMPPYANAQLTITLAETGEIVLCGACVVGQSRDIGGTQYGANISIMDYSVKQRDAFGNYTILERAFNKRGKFSLWVDNSFVDELQTILASVRATPIVYIGSDNFRSSVIYGFYKDFSTVISYSTLSLCDIELEGLT